MEYCRCLVGKAGRIDDVRICFSFSYIYFVFLGIFLYLHFVLYVCMCRIQSWKSPMIYFLAVQLSALVVALVDLHRNKFGLVSRRDSCWGNFLSAVEHLGL